MSPDTGVRPSKAATSAFVGAELSFATRVITKVAEPFDPLLPLPPFAPLYAIARIGFAVSVQSSVDVVVVAVVVTGYVIDHK
jgi:hypothetical protein